jgi:DNA-binding NarL/FixJ family response regulator
MGMSPANSAATEKSTAQPGPGQVLLIGKDHQLGIALEESLKAQGCEFVYAAGSADALRRLRQASYDVVITDPTTSIEEDLALLSEIRAICPGVRVIVLAPSSTPEEVIAALRARVFLCISAPFDVMEVAAYAARAATALDAPVGIEVLSAQPNWVSVRANCQRLTAERLVSFLKELQSELADSPREELMLAFREILLNAIEHGAAFRSGQVIEVAAVRTDRAIVFYVKDPGPGFRWSEIAHAAVSNPEHDPTHHLVVREEKGLRPGGFGILIARGIVDELIYSEVGSEVLMIKHRA